MLNCWQISIISYYLTYFLTQDYTHSAAGNVTRTFKTSLKVFLKCTALLTRCMPYCPIRKLISYHCSLCKCKMEKTSELSWMDNASKKNHLKSNVLTLLMHYRFDTIVWKKTWMKAVGWLCKCNFLTDTLACHIPEATSIVFKSIWIDYVLSCCFFLKKWHIYYLFTKKPKALSWMLDHPPLAAPKINKPEASNN